MNDQTKKIFLQALFFAAWTDGSLQAEESRVLQMLSTGLSFDDPNTVSGMSEWFKAAPPEPEWKMVPDDHISTLMREVATVIAIDGVITHDELALFKRVAGKFGLAEQQWQKILVDVESTLRFD